jgi:hypothetical protein
MLAARNAPLLQRLVDTGRPVGSPTLVVNPANHFRVLTILALATARLASSAGVVATAGDLQDLAHHAYPEGLPMLLDETELHFWSSAK